MVLFVRRILRHVRAIIDRTCGCKLRSWCCDFLENCNGKIQDIIQVRLRIQIPFWRLDIVCWSENPPLPDTLSLMPSRGLAGSSLVCRVACGTVSTATVPV